MLCATRPKAVIESFANIHPKCEQGVYIHSSACVIGDVVLGVDVSVWPLATVRGDVHSIRIGEQSNVQDNAVLHCTHDGIYSPGGAALTIGAQVTVGHSAVLHGATIGNQVLIGIGAVVLDYAVVPDEVMLGAHTLVPPKIILESGYLYVGSPAKKHRRLTDKEKAFLRYSAEHYVRLKNKYRTSE